MTPPVIAVNARFRDRPMTGVERYAAEIAACLHGPSIEIRPLARYPGALGHFWEQMVLPQRSAGSVLWSPANTGPVRHPAHVLTIHDIAPLEHPEWYRPSFAAWYRYLWPLLARNAHLMTVSEFSQARIAEHFQLPADRIVVAPVGVDPEVFFPRRPEEIDALRVKYELPGPYILFVGTVQPRKNLAGLLAAWAQVSGEFPDHCLVIAGSAGPVFSQEEYGNRSSVRMLGRIPDMDLPALYSGAAAFVQPSFYEGAGLTVLEAMACGCPVAAAGTTALPEYTGDCALLFDPIDTAAITSAVRAILADRELAAGLQSSGIERARAFTWARSAKTVEDFLRSISLQASPKSRRRPRV